MGAVAATRLSGIPNHSPGTCSSSPPTRSPSSTCNCSSERPSAPAGPHPFASRHGETHAVAALAAALPAPRGAQLAVMSGWHSQGAAVDTDRGFARRCALQGASPFSSACMRLPELTPQRPQQWPNSSFASLPAVASPPPCSTFGFGGLRHTRWAGGGAHGALPRPCGPCRCTAAVEPSSMVCLGSRGAGGACARAPRAPASGFPPCRRGPPVLPRASMQGDSLALPSATPAFTLGSSCRCMVSFPLARVAAARPRAAPAAMPSQRAACRRPLVSVNESSVMRLTD